MISIIVAASTNGVIGRKGDLPWRMPADLKRFKSLTMGHHLVVGRKTWDEVARPLPGRIMIVVTRDPEFRAEGVTTVHSLDEALETAIGDDQVFIAGGGEIYRQAMPLADRLYLTRVHAIVDGDTTFEFDEGEWVLVSRDDHLADERDPHPYSFLIYERNV
jgi:dihydrofolate reductase